MPTEGTTGDPPDARVRVVIVDDDPQVRDVLVMACGTRPGLEVVAVADTGEAGVDAVEEHTPDVVVLDLAMPGRGGQWAAGEMLGSAPGLAIVVLSAHVARSLERELMAVGVRAVFHKGDSITALLDLLEQVGRAPG